MTAPIAHYKLNGDVLDASGNGHHGTPTDVSFVAGKIRQAASFNGSTSRVQLPASNAIMLASFPWTILVWWTNRQSTPSSERMIQFHRGASAGGAVALQVLTVSSNFRFSYVWHNGSGFVNMLLPTFLTPDVFYFSALSYDGTTFRSYHQGELVDSTIDTFSGFGSFPAFVGHFDGTNPIHGVNGLIDGVRIYGEALPAWEVKDIFDFEKGTEKVEPWQRLIQPVIRRTAQSLIGAA